MSVACKVTTVPGGPLRGENPSKRRSAKSRSCWPGNTVGDYTSTDNGDGTSTFSNGTNSITYTTGSMPTFNTTVNIPLFPTVGIEKQSKFLGAPADPSLMCHAPNDGETATCG